MCVCVLLISEFVYTTKHVFKLSIASEKFNVKLWACGILIIMLVY